MALKIVRATDDERLANPLRLWYAGRHDDALAALAKPDGHRFADEAPKLYELALTEDPARAARIGAALGGWEDATAGYRVLKVLCEGLIDQIGPAGAERWVPRGIAMVELVRPWLDRRPAEPVLLNYLGVAVYGLNEPALAVRVLQAAERLDAGLENLAGSLAAARARVKRPVKSALTPRERLAVNGFRTFLKALPARVERDRLGDVRISLCMIVRDEEEMLGECLESCRDGVDEMIIVDTGSTDGTVEIAESFGATVLHFAWNGSFSDARNVGIDAATGTHVLWLDADERLEEGDALRLRALAAQPYREAHWLVETNFTGQDEVGMAANHLALRLWRHRPPYRFSGAIHEQIRIAMPIDLPERFAISNLRIRHYGYLKSRIEQKNKHERNLELLLAELKRTPNSAFTHFNLGTEYASIGDTPRAAEHLEESLRLIRQEPGWHEIAYASLLVTRLIGVRRRAGDIDGADGLAEDMLRVYPTFTDLVFERGLCARERGDLEGARIIFNRCLEMGDAPARFAGMVGRGSFLALAALASVAADLGDRAAAVAYLERSLREYPAYLPAGLELADTLLAEPDADPAGVLERLESAHNDQATWWLFLGTAFYERGHADEAERLFRRALERAPGNAAATVGLAETLLTQHRYDDLLAEVGDLPEATAAAIALERCRVLAGVAAGDAAAATAAVERFGHGGDADELRFLEAFAGLAADVAPGRLDQSAAPYAVQMLDALARLEEFELFERLVPMAEQAIGDPRMAALSLSELFAARGFWRLSGDWAMRAIEIGGPEPRALAALGKAAVAEGMFEDALPVLEAALDLDPSQISVRTLLTSVRMRLAA
jgi:glycosyltransferase involved in cell wall biosynthesis/Flp pilus assembly protein TadD